MIANHFPVRSSFQLVHLATKVGRFWPPALLDTFECGTLKNAAGAPISCLHTSLPDQTWTSRMVRPALLL
jgi:hypothetical protein